MIPPLERDPRYRLLDVWRGVACLMVVVHHAAFPVFSDAAVRSGSTTWLRWTVATALERMNLGVALFFVISGYCIAASADATRRRGIRPLTFLSRRVWRIYPPYWAALLVFVVAVAGLDALGLGRLHSDGARERVMGLDSPGELSLVQWAGNLTLTEEWRPLVTNTPPRNVFTRVAWSLCYEEQFYFVCFLALLVAPRRLWGILVTVTVASLAIRLGAKATGRIPWIEGSFPMLWHQFAAGLAVYWRLNVPAPRLAKRAVDLGLVMLALLGAVGLSSKPGQYATPVAAVFALVLIAMRGWDERADALGWLRPLRACGRRCYSIYLVHLPVCTIGGLCLLEAGMTGFWTWALVLVPVLSVVAVAVSWPFWEVERRFLNPPIIQRGPERSPADLGPLVGESAEATGPPVPRIA